MKNSFDVVRRILFASSLLVYSSAYALLSNEITVSDIHRAIAAHRITCEALINQYVDRIKHYNLSTSKQISLNAFTEINADAIDQARRLDAFFLKNKRFQGSLHCVPVALKDNIDSYDSTSTSGSLALLGNQPVRDAFLVSQLRQAGAVILGKTSMDEMGAGMFGFSSRSGRVGNAYDARMNPGGSSGGSAVAVSVNFAVIGVGTDNSGSVRIPAAFNGVYGLRPSTGLISQCGVFPAGNLDGTAGLMTRSVEDMARALDVVATQSDSCDAKTKHVPRVQSYMVFLKSDGLQKKRIGVVRQVGEVNTFEGMPKKIEKLYRDFFEHMKRSGATFEDIQLPNFNTHREWNMAGMREDVNAYLESYPAVRKSSRDFCESNRTRVYGSIQECLKFFRVMPNKWSDQYKHALTMFQRNRKHVERMMTERKLDALLVPISQVGVATYDGMRVNTWRAPLSSNSGLPAMTIHVGNSDGMPVGAELVGKYAAEGSLIAMVYAHEKQSESRKPPVLLEKTDVFNDVDTPSYNRLLTKVGYRTYMTIVKDAYSESVSLPDALTPDQFQQRVRYILQEMHR